MSLHVQTEYAWRPYPRLTTTIINKGQVVHKIEKKLDHPVDSPEEQIRIEDIMKRQHSDVVAIIRRTDLSTPQSEPSVVRAGSHHLPLIERIKAVPGIEYTFQLDVSGTFSGKVVGEQFRKVFPKIHRNVRELIEIFARIPGVTSSREKGIYEVERNRLYLISCGDELYFVSIRDAAADIVYEKTLREIMDEYDRQYAVTV